MSVSSIFGIKTTTQGCCFNLFCDLLQIGKLEFEAPDLDKFPCLKLAYDVAKQGKSYPIVLNAANEIAVGLFLEEQISFVDIEKIISRSLELHSPIEIKSLDEVLQIDKEIRIKSKEMLGSLV